jgi:hypothetical protein
VTERDPTIEANDRSRDRLDRLVRSLNGDSLRIAIGDWTVATLLCHLAFWDRFVLQRWTSAVSAGKASPDPIDADITDLLNEALRPLLSEVPVERAGAVGMDAAAEVDRQIAQLDPTVRERLRIQGRTRLVDRSIHRLEHLAEIDDARNRSRNR